MAETNRSRSSRTRSEAEALKGDLPDRVAEATEKGYYGTVPDVVPNEEYSLEGGPPTITNAEAIARNAAAGVAGADATATDETDTDADKE